MKKLFSLIILQTGRLRLLKYTLLGILSGLWSFCFINFITHIINLIVSDKLKVVSKEYISIFVIITVLFIWTRKVLSFSIINLSQVFFWNLRMQVLSSVLKANYSMTIKKKSKIHTAMINDVQVLTQVSMTIIDFLASCIVSIACLIYLASISVTLFCITISVTFLGMIIYQLNVKRNLRALEKARNLEDNFIENFNSILNGYKEIYMEPKNGSAIYNNKISAIANDAYKNNIIALTGFLNNQVTGQLLFKLLISSILLFFSIKLGIKTNDTVTFVFILLYLLNSIEAVMLLLPGLAKAKISGNHLIELKTELEERETDKSQSSECILKKQFNKLSVRDLKFDYIKVGHSFGIGPINFDIQKSEVVFIYGGNGSGKTTFLHSILGLHEPSSGEIMLNNQMVNKANFPVYRTAFSVVFSDFYLFNELFAIEKLNVEKWNYYLELFEIDDKVKLEGMRFSTTDLSTGQRKRLALIALLLEEKPILVIDEWAADQDPYFRKKFYTEIIPLLKKDGIAIIAITHDDKYYKCADKLYKMSEGKLFIEKSTSAGMEVTHS